MPTSPSFRSTGKNRELITGMSRSNVARDSRTFATNSSPATPASARTGSGPDQNDCEKSLKLIFIFIAHRVFLVLRYAAVFLLPFVAATFRPSCFRRGCYSLVQHGQL